jgi:CBS domain-containing protein
MKKNEPVSTIMTTHVHSVQLKDTLANAFNLVRKHHIRHIPVLEGKKLVGILSRNDLNRLAFSNVMSNEEDADEAVFEMLSIAQVMTNRPRVVKSSETIKTIAEIFVEGEFHALPVVAEQDDTKLVGIVTTTDVIRYMLAQYH